MRVFKPEGPQPLGRVKPETTDHIEKYHLAAIDPPTRTPVVVGVDWYEAFDMPIWRNGRYELPTPKERWGYIRGGHAVCLQPLAMSDQTAWWEFYDQKQTSMCVGFSSSRCMTLLNRAKYDARWLYYEAQRVMGQPKDPDSGTSILGAMKVLQAEGHKTLAWDAPRIAQGIKAFRWTINVNDVATVLNRKDATHFPVLNSWGKLGWPHVAWIPRDTLDFLLFEGGEAAIPTDR